jgi:HTH-type transcriptional regulator, glycine betaine synthesis regulator
MPETDSQPALETCQVAIVSIFADLAELFGNPRSYGILYGLLFTSDKPLNIDIIRSRSRMSQGSISQGLRVLESFGAVTRETLPGSRTATYRAKLEMRVLIAGFLKERVIPRIESTEQRVRSLQETITSLEGPDAATLSQRIERLAKWHTSAKTVLPIAKKILGG